MSSEHDTPQAQATGYHSLDTTIDLFIGVEFSEEQSADLRLSLELLQRFDYPEIDFKLLNIVALEGFEDPSATRDKFYYEVFSMIKDLLVMHGLTVSDSCSLSHANMFAEAFWLIQHRDDYEPFVAIFTSTLSDEEMMISFMQEFCQIDEASFLENVSELRSTLVKTLKSYVLSKHERSQGPELSTPEEYAQKAALIERLKLIDTLHPSTLGVALMAAGVMPMQPFSVYIKLIEDDLVFDSIEAAAFNILSLSTLSKGAAANPIEDYKNNLGLMGSTFDDYRKIEPKLLEIHSRLLELERVRAQESRMNP